MTRVAFAGAPASALLLEEVSVFPLGEMSDG